MGLREVGPGDDLRGARVADIDGSEIFRRALMSQPQDTAPVLGDLDRHALANAAEPVELVMCELPKIPSCGVGHLCSLPLIGAYRITRWPHSSRAALKRPAGNGNGIRGTVLSRRQAGTESWGRVFPRGAHPRGRGG